MTDFGPHWNVNAATFVILRDVPVVVIGHIVPVHHFDSPQPLRVIDTFKARDSQPQWETLLRTYSLAILAVAH